MSIRFWISHIGEESALARIFTHSFELIGLYLSGAVGFYGATILIKFLFDKISRVSKCVNVSLFFMIIAILIIVFAGFIEGYVSLCV